MLGGGRTTPEQKINYTTGFTSFCQIGDKVDEKRRYAISTLKTKGL